MKTFSTRMARRVLTAVATTVILSLVFWACQKEATDTSPNENMIQSVKAVDGILVFENKKSFDDLMVSLSKKQSELSTWEQTLLGFKSMRTAYNELSPNVLEKVAKTGSIVGYENIISIRSYGDDKEIVRNIYDPILASVVNHEALIQIGKTLYKVGLEKLYSVPEMSRAVLQNFKHQSGQSLSGVKAETIVDLFNCLLSVV